MTVAIKWAVTSSQVYVKTKIVSRKRIALLAAVRFGRIGYCELHPKRVKKDDPACYGFMKWDNTETNESITSCPQIGGDDNKVTIGDSHIIQKFGPDKLNLEDYVK